MDTDAIVFLVMCLFALASLAIVALEAVTANKADKRRYYAAIDREYRELCETTTTA
jgi:hypothetical protein